MLRLSVIIVALAAAFALAAPAAAQTCSFAPGDYVDVDLAEDVVVPAYVIEASGDPCYVTVRILATPGQPFDAYTPSYFADYIAPLDGPPPYDKPYGCPYAPGDAVDLRDQYGDWYPGRVTGSDRYCGYEAEYWMETELKTFGAIDADLRTATLAPPTEADFASAAEAAAEAALCPAGGGLADYPGEDLDALVRRGVITEIGLNLGADANVWFDSLRAGETAIATEGSIAHSRNPDASVGTTIHPFRMEVTVCVAGEPAAEVSRLALDYSCYRDRFGDFACRRDSGRLID